MINLILCYPPKKDYKGFGQDRSWFPLGIASLAAYIDEHANKYVNITCLDLFDFTHEQALTEIKKYLNYTHINLIGFTMMTEQRFSVIELCSDLKKFAYSIQNESLNLKTIVGGAHASIMYNQISIEYKAIIDHIIVGEGEKALLDICGSYENYGCYNNKIIKFKEVDDLNEFPYAYYGIKFFKDISINKDSEIPIVISRGCTDRCHFCSTFKTWKTYRYRTAYNVFSEMLLYNHDFGVTKFKFMDDSATGALNEFKVLAKMIENNNHLNNFSYELTARADQFDHDLIKLLGRSGCWRVSVGIESGCEEQRRSMNKKLNIEKAKDNINQLRLNSIKVNLLFFVGWPGETEETIQETCNFIYESNADSNSKMPLMIFPGTAIYEKLKKEKWINDDYWLEDQPQPFYTKEHSLKKLYEWCDDLSFAIKRIEVIIAAVVNQDEETFKLYLDSCNKLNIPRNVKVKKFFILHNSEHLEKYLEKDEYLSIKNDLEYNSKNHNWDIDKFLFIAEAKNNIVAIAKKKWANYIFWVDSDLILHEDTLKQLISVNVPVISRIFWTVWPGTDKEMPNCWDVDHYGFANDINMLKEENVYQTGGTGACILVRQDVYNGVIDYSHIPNISFSLWEDRAFCIKCHIFKIPIYIDTRNPAKHLYRQQDLEDYKKLVYKSKKAEKV